MITHYKKWFVTAIALKMLLAWLVPLTSDEAYWYAVGQNFYTNYYDHPPMICWIVYLFSAMGSHIFFCRLFPVLCSVVVSLGIYLYTKRVYNNAHRARLVSLIFLFAPLNILFVPIASDSALGLFVFLSGAMFCYGLSREKDRHIFLAGIFLGLAVLSKYFSGLLLIALVVCLLCYPGKKRAARYLLVLLAGAMPFVLVHLFWNYNSCWTNIMFNVINRNSNVTLEYTGLLKFIAFQIYLAMPWCLYYLARNIKGLLRDVRNRTNYLFWLFTVPVSLFGIISFQETGLHWVLAFYPFFFMLLIYLPKVELIKVLKFTVAFSVIHIILVLAVLMVPLERVKNYEYYRDIVLSMHGDELVDQIRSRYGPDYILGSNGYYTSGVLTYFSGQYAIVFHDNSSFGRQDDKVTDYRALDGKDFVILSTLKIKDDYSIYFDQLRYDTITIKGNTFYLAVGKGFKYNVYRERFLKKVLHKFYNIPDYLPLGQCFFYDKYFPESRR